MGRRSWDPHRHQRYFEAKTTKGVDWVKIEYDQEADALYVQFRSVLVEDNMDVEEGVTVDLDKDGHIVGIEILGARKRLGAKAIANISIENLSVE